MIPEQIHARQPKILSSQQRDFYFENGYLLIERVIPQQWLDRLIDTTAEMVQRSRSLRESNSTFDLEPDHSADNPRLRRLSSPADHHDAYWEFASDSPLADIAADLLGPDVKFHHSKLNFKWAQGGEQVKWHQDITFWPHTNYSPLTMGTYLDDVGDEQGPLGVIPGSHQGELFNQYNDNDQWIGCLRDEDLQQIDIRQAIYLTGPAGSVTVHNCRTLHGSKRNLSDTGRPLLLNAYSAADAFPYTPNPLFSRHAGKIVRGKPARWARHDPRGCLIPPDWSGGYTSIYALQQEQDVAAKKIK